MMCIQNARKKKNFNNTKLPLKETLYLSQQMEISKTSIKSILTLLIFVSLVVRIFFVPFSRLFKMNKKKVFHGLVPNQSYNHS